MREALRPPEVSGARVGERKRERPCSTGNPGGERKPMEGEGSVTPVETLERGPVPYAEEDLEDERPSPCEGWRSKRRAGKRAL
jgi:hypothetical protein